MKDRFNKPTEPDDKEDKLQALKDFSEEQMREHGPTHFLLDDSGNVVPASLFEWAFWYERSGQRVIQQDYPEDCKVSTIFVGIDLGYSFAANRKPRVFETMVFGPEYMGDFFGKPMTFRPELWTERCSTLTEALAAHQAGLEWLNDYLHERTKTKETGSPG